MIATGNVTEYAAYGTDGKPIINSSGFHKKIRSSRTVTKSGPNTAMWMARLCHSTRVSPP